MAEKMSTRDAYGKALLKLGETNDRVVVLDADLWTSTRTQWFREKWPERFIDIGIAEQNLIGVAAGVGVVAVALLIRVDVVGQVGMVDVDPRVDDRDDLALAGVPAVLHRVEVDQGHRLGELR